MEIERRPIYRASSQVRIIRSPRGSAQLESTNCIATAHQRGELEKTRKEKWMKVVQGTDFTHSSTEPRKGIMSEGKF